MFAFDVMALNEHIIPKMLICHLTLFCKMVLIYLVTNQLIDTYSSYNENRFALRLELQVN